MTTLRSVVLGAVILPLLSSMPAAAQATRTWVSGVGDDANPCSRTAPCKTFQGTISKTAAGGEIDVLDPGGFGAVTITKAITIAGEGTGEAGILVVGTNGIIVNAGPNDAVVLRGLIIDGGPTGSNSLAGVKFIAGGSLIIQNCVIRNFTGGSPNGYGVAFIPSGNASLFMSDSTVSNNGVGTTGGGIFIQPTSTSNVKASLVRVNALNNIVGIRSDGGAGTGSITLAVSDSTASGNTFAGMSAFTPVNGASIKMAVSNSVSANNGTGLNANGVGVTFRVGGSVITSNATGANILNGATMTSLGTNLISDNPNPGSSIPIVGPQ